MYVKIHKSGNNELLAVSDEDIVGKTFVEKGYQLTVSEIFYKGEKKSSDEVIRLIKRYDNINLVGKEVVKLVLDKKIVSKENVICIEGTPHIQIYSM